MMNIHNVRRLAVASALVVGAFCAPTFAADDDVVARVGERTITKSVLDAAAERLGSQFARVPEDQRRARILDALIDFAVLAKEAEKAGIDKEPETQRLLEYLRLQALHNAYFRREIESQITEEKLKARYEKQVAEMAPQKEVRARHILLKTQEEAKGVIAELEGGADFEALAKEKSTGPSGPQGGDLGFFTRGRMVPEFEQAAFALEPGTFSKEPVQTQFGFHVIKVEEMRDVAPPTFEQSRQQVTQVLMAETYSEAVSKAREAQKVEVLDPALKLPQQAE